MTKKRIRNILIAFISLISIAIIMTVSFAAWDVKTGDNQFTANAGKRIQVTADNSGTFNKTLYPDGFQPLDANGNLKPTDGSGIYIYSVFKANYLNNKNEVTTDTSYIKNTKLRWKYQVLAVNGVSILTSDLTGILSTSVFDAWLASSATYEKPSAEYLVEPKNGELKAGVNYYFVIRFKSNYIKTYKHTDNKTYYFSSNGTYTTSASATKKAINSTNLGAVGLPFNKGVYDYANAPYTEEKLDTTGLDAYIGKQIKAVIEIYADGGTVA